MTREEFGEFLLAARQELADKQEKFVTESNVSGYEEYWIDIANGTLDFIEGEAGRISYEVICIGTWSETQRSWMWAWAHESFPAEIRRQSAVLQELSVRTNSPVFRTETFGCEEAQAIELTAMSVRHLNAIGMYRIPGEQAQLYVAVMKKRSLQ
ncbi:DUF6882 domain-containing protein [Saccharibacillus deserti]|uniref:DUF6882 domain-containing protein n=1 Tax=Saccharibacillus deserti TaxID=1634444 RepID=UPI0015556A1C|nr:DUF6882 domain-containing protein [Saccharibacillus deserti]